MLYIWQLIYKHLQTARKRTSTAELRGTRDTIRLAALHATAAIR